MQQDFVTEYDKAIEGLARLRLDIVKESTFEFMGLDCGLTDNDMDYYNYFANNPVLFNLGGGGSGSGDPSVVGGKLLNPLSLNISNLNEGHHIVLWRYDEYQGAGFGSTCNNTTRASGNTLDGIIYDYKTNDVISYSIEDVNDAQANHIYPDVDSNMIPSGGAWCNKNEVHRGQSGYCAKLAGGKGGFGSSAGSPGTMLAMACNPSCLFHYGKDVSYSAGCILLGTKSVKGDRPSFDTNAWKSDQIETTTNEDVMYWRKFYDYVVPKVANGEKVFIHVRFQKGSISVGGGGMNLSGIGDGVAAVNGAKVYGANSSATCVNTRNTKPQWIVVHYTAGTSSGIGTARSVCEGWVKKRQSGEKTGSADFVVDDGEIWQFSADVSKYATWNCGDSISRNGPKHPEGGAYKSQVSNQNSIGIELCSSLRPGYDYRRPNNGGWYYTDAVMRNGIALIRGLMQKFGIPKSNIVRHYDVTGKQCPGIVGWNMEAGSNSSAEWQRFKASI